jgi:hypothetical protein
MVEHHRADQIWPIGLATPWPAMSGAEPCTGSNSDGNALRVDVGRGRDADGAGAGGAEVGQDVAEEVGATTTSNQSGMQHEVRGQDVDVELVQS